MGMIGFLMTSKKSRYMHNRRSFLFVTFSLGGGGAERALSRFANALAKRGHSVHIYSYEHMPVEYEIDSSIEVTYSRLSRMYGGAGKLQKYWEDARAVRRMYRTEKYDYVIPFCTEMVICTYFGLIGSGASVVATERNSPVDGCRGAVKRWIRDYVYRRCSAIWVQNAAQRKFYRNLSNRPIFVVPNIVEIKPKKRNCVTPITRFINVGRLAPQKNQRMLIEAFSQAVCKHPEIELDIFGSGPLEGELTRQIQLHELSDRIHIRGYSSCIFNELGSHDAFLFSSDYEGLPNALIEALLIGLPVVSTEFETGSEDLIENGKTGITVACGDTEGFAAAICDVVENPEHAYELASCAIAELTSHFSEEGLIALLLEKCEEIKND